MCLIRIPPPIVIFLKQLICCCLANIPYSTKTIFLSAFTLIWHPSAQLQLLWRVLSQVLESFNENAWPFFQQQVCEIEHWCWIRGPGSMLKVLILTWWPHKIQTSAETAESCHPLWSVSLSIHSFSFLCSNTSWLSCCRSQSISLCFDVTDSWLE